MADSTREYPGNPAYPQEALLEGRWERLWGLMKDATRRKRDIRAGGFDTIWGTVVTMMEHMEREEFGDG